jgi:hypothetical protein
MQDRRGPWFLITGLILGIGLGVFYSWAISPLKYVDTAPFSLRADFKDQYRSMVALAYAADGDSGRARVRLALLKDSDPPGTLAAQAQRLVAAGSSPAEARALAQLAVMLNKGGEVDQSTQLASSTVVPVAAPVTATPTASLTITPTQAQTATPATLTPLTNPSLTPQRTPTRLMTPTLQAALATPLPTFTATPTQGLPFVLKSREKVCEPEHPQPLLQIEVTDSAGQPAGGVQISIAWQNKDEQFFTGLKPELGLGFADFMMEPKLTYALRVGDGGQTINDLTPPQCYGSSGLYWGGLFLKYEQP